MNSSTPVSFFSVYRRLVFAFCCFLFFAACKTGSKINPVDPVYSKYVEAYTSGVVSKTSAIRVRLSSEISTAATLNEPVKDELFSFSPSVKGKTYWVDARTIEFRPDENLKPDQLYTVHFRLNKVADVPDELKTFTFNVQAVKPAFQLQEYGLKVVGNSKEAMLFSGAIETADVEDGVVVEKILDAGFRGKALTVKWEHDEMARLHKFTVDGINRGSEASMLVLNWDGAPLNVNEKSRKEIEVPAVGDFKVLSVRAVQDAENYVLIQFSDAVATNQQLSGLINLSNKPDISYSIDGNEVKLYAADNMDGDYTVSVVEGVLNVWAAKLDKAFSGNVFFENRLPSVRMQGRGVILPDAGKLVLPFEAVNLNAVDVSIIKIYENNIPQFLQYNALGGEYDLRRVASPVVKQTIRLDNDKTLDLHRRQKFSLDIDKYLKAEPGAIYHVLIGFRPEYSLYKCITSDKTDEEDEDYYYYNAWYYDESEGSNSLDSDDEFWKAYDSYYPYGYNWRQRNNPCSPSYYSKDKWASRNIMASNIGLTAKRGTDNSMMVAVTDILTAAPMSDVELEVLDYQQQVLHKVKSDGKGWAVFDLKKKPHLLVAKKGNEKGYLKLDDGSSLLLSRFDVSGAQVKNGLKGFIYGERGVWRPGDTMYLNFIVEDKAGKLPKDHPVEFNLLTPQGQMYKKDIQKGNEQGFYLFTTSTDMSSVTGNWLARIKVGGAVFEKRVKVETVMPNRLKIDLDFGKNAMLGTGGAGSGTLRSQWLFGAPAKNLKAKVDAVLVSRKTAFKKYPQFHFDNLATQFSSENKTLFDGTLNENGVSPVNARFDVHGAPGMLNASMLVKVFEPGGAFSVGNVVLPYSPYKSYVGINMPEGPKPWKFLMTDKSYELPIVNVDASGDPLSGKQSIAIEMYRISWSWWWDNTGEGLSNFSRDRYSRLTAKDTVSLNNGTGKWNLKAPGGEWGRYLVLAKDMQSGHTTGQVVYFDDPWWQTRGNNDPSAAAMLSFTANKEKFDVGEEISLNIPSGEGGRALISIESGSRVLKTDWVETKQGQTIYTFKAEPGMAPNIYVNISLLQPHSQTVNDLPIRMYGVIPVLIEDKNTVLKPSIQMPDVLRPEQPSSITVSEASGKEMAYNIAIVDEGLLDLTRFKTPDPHGAFYAREALGVKSWDLFDNVVGAWGTGLERILTIGGDEAASGAGKEKSANRFKPVVKYLGPFYLKKGQKQKHDFTLPPYIGSVRAMVVAAHNGAYGFSEKAVAVKKPLMLLGTLPRVLGPTEVIKLPVTVFAMENNIRNVTVSLENNAFLEPVGGTSQQVHFSEPGEQMVYFDVRVKENTGIGKVKLLASAGNEKADYEVELDVRNPNPVVSNVTEKAIGSGQSWTETVTPIGIPANGKATLEISAIPPINLEKRLSYLIRYPYGCLEQITSAVFPQLFLKQLVELSDRRKAEVERNVRAVIEKYRNYHQPDGGFGYWTGTGESDDWATSYAGYFLVKAQEQGYIVPADMLQQWITYQKGKAAAWAPSSNNFYGGDLAQAFRLYLLALVKSPDLGAMNRLREFKYLSPEAKWRLAAAYQLAGHSKTAESLVAGLPTEFEERKMAGYTFGSSLRDQSMVLETLTLMNKRNEAESVLKSVSKQLAGESWYSTQTTAYSLLAIASYCGSNPSGEKMVAEATVNGKKITINSGAYVSLTDVDVNAANKTVSVVNKGSNMLYARLVVQGQPLTGEQVQATNNPDVLAMTVSYLTLDGKAIDNIEALQQGTDFVAKVTLRNPGIRGRYHNLTLSQIFPGGWEILNTRMLDAGEAFKSSPSDHQDIRDDRVYTHFGLREGETKTYYLMLNAAYLGRYFLPGVYCEGMYDNTISAGVSGRWVEVK